MDIETVKAAMETAKYYPSGDNCQGFSFRWHEKALHIDYSAKSFDHSLVFDSSTILMTLGFLNEYIRNSFAESQKQVNFVYDFKNFDVHADKQSLCKVSESQCPEITLQTYPKRTLLDRVTDRRPYLDYSTIELDEFEIEHTHSKSKLIKNVSSDVLDFFAHCDSLVWTSKKLALDIMSTVTFSSPPSKKGLPWQNLGLKKSETLPIKLLQKYPWLFSVFRTLGAQNAMKKSQAALWHSSSSILVFSYKKGISYEDKVLANMELMNKILELVDLGYSFQPSTISTFILNVPLNPQTNIKTETGIQLDSISSQIPQIREKLNLGDNEVNWVLRFGKTSSPLDQSNRTLRLPLSEILNI
ncbi:hypothetical protein QX776_05255 [Alteromonadaceae bacterium BrNp21-10]|nr:hypothetical protein [Alteromonadaceae bacterium BrNp21-10]